MKMPCTEMAKVNQKFNKLYNQSKEDERDKQVVSV